MNPKRIEAAKQRVKADSENFQPLSFLYDAGAPKLPPNLVKALKEFNTVLDVDSYSSSVLPNGNLQLLVFSKESGKLRPDEIAALGSLQMDALRERYKLSMEYDEGEGGWSIELTRSGSSIVRSQVSAGDTDQAKAWSAEFNRMSVPVKLLDSDGKNTTFSVEADSSLNSHTNDALSKGRLEGIVSALNIIEGRNPGTSSFLAFNTNSGHYEIEIHSK